MEYDWDDHDELLANSVLDFEKPHPAQHPTQKPIALCEMLIKTYTNEYDVVLDSCASSGTIPKSCISTSRQWIAFETDLKYFNTFLKPLCND